MGIIFCNSHHATLCDLSNGRARLFIAMAQLAMEHTALYSTGLSEIRGDECYVEEKQFCLLVETVLANPINLLYVWAEEAAGIYEVIKGKRFQWVWRGRDEPHFPFRPVRRAGLVPELEDQRIIGTRRS